MIVHNAVDLIYLVLLIVCLVSFWQPKDACGSSITARIGIMQGHALSEHFLIFLAIAFTVVFLLEDIKMIVRKRYLFLKSFWNPFAFISHLLMVTGGSILEVYFMNFSDKETCEYDRAKISGNHPISIGMTLVSISVGMEIFKRLRFLMLFQFLGPIVLCITSVFKDIVRVASVYGIMYASKLFETIVIIQDIHRHIFNADIFSVTSPQASPCGHS